MTCFFIDDNRNFAEKMAEEIAIKNARSFNIYTANDELRKGEVLLIAEKDELPELADEIRKALLPGDDAILFINIDLLIGTEKRQFQKGAELLIWLRIKGVMNHCLLYSFRTIPALLKAKPEHLVILSTGTTFAQLPSDFAELDLEQLCVKRAEEQNLRTTLKPAFNMAAFRHSDANWWGLKCMWDAHRAAQVHDFKKDYPGSLSKKLNDLNNGLANYFYGSDKPRLAKYISEYEEKEKVVIEGDKIRLNKAMYECNVLDSRVKMNDSIEEFSLAALEDEIAELEKKLSRRFRRPRPIIEKIQSLEGEIRETRKINFKENEGWKKALKHQEELILMLRKRIDKTVSVVDDLLNIKDRFFQKINLPEINQNVRVLHIDDQVHNGWGEIFQYIIFSTISTNNYKGVSPDKIYRNDIPSLYSQCVKNEIENFKPSLILLDFRLFDEKDNSLEIDAISGKRLLEEIRKDSKGIPIVITTASNKIWTYEALMKMGADAYWIKEGIDESRTAEETINNYVDFKRIVAGLSSREYNLLRVMTDTVSAISKNPSANWWNCKDWNVRIIDVDGEPRDIASITNVDTTDLTDIYSSGIELYREFLTRKILQTKYNIGSSNDWFYFASIIVHLGKIVELIHNLYTREFQLYKNFKKVLETRGDREGMDIYDTRNDSAHLDRSRSVDFQKFSSFIIRLNSYLK